MINEIKEQTADLLVALGCTEAEAEALLAERPQAAETAAERDGYFCTCGDWMCWWCGPRENW